MPETVTVPLVLVLVVEVDDIVLLVEVLAGHASWKRAVLLASTTVPVKELK